MWVQRVQWPKKMHKRKSCAVKVLISRDRHSKVMMSEARKQVYTAKMSNTNFRDLYSNTFYSAKIHTNSYNHYPLNFLRSLSTDVLFPLHNWMLVLESKHKALPELSSSEGATHKVVSLLVATNHHHHPHNNVIAIIVTAEEQLRWSQ